MTREELLESPDLKPARIAWPLADPGETRLVLEDAELVDGYFQLAERARRNPDSVSTDDLVHAHNRAQAALRRLRSAGLC